MQDDRPDVATPRIHALVGDAVLAVWDDAVPARPSQRAPHRVDVAAAGKPVPRTQASLTLATTWGGTRTLVALRWPAAQRGDALTFSSQGTPVAEAPGHGAREFDAGQLVGGLAPASQAKVLSCVLEFCRAAFAQRDERRFAAVAGALLAELFPEPAPLVPVIEAARGLTLAQGALPADGGEIVRALVVERSRVRAVAARPVSDPSGSRNGQTPFHLMLDDCAEGARIVLFAADGAVACRELRGALPALRLHEWLERTPVPHSVRDCIAAGLTARGATHPEAAAVLDEMQLLAPLPHRAVFAKSRPLGADIDLALSDGKGLFVSGWLRDPHDMIARIDAVSALGERRDLGAPMVRFPRPDVADQYGERTGERWGFATYVPNFAGGTPSRQHRFELHLRSGAVLDLVPALPPQDPRQARDAVLGAVPPTFASPEALDCCIGPAVAALHAATMATRREPERIEFGTPVARPRATIVVPLYRVLDFLRFQISAFAVDRSLADVELIYVLDSPEQRDECEHLLLGLHALYGVPMTLLVQSANYGFSSACNTGGRAARGPATLFLNSDVIPDRPGWLEPLLAELADPRVGAVGPKLLFDDQSLQHAGMFFGRDLRGAWLNQHFHKGMPRDYQPACVARSVPAVTGAAILLPTELVNRVGGFCEDYVIGDYEDSDLCLKVRALGFDIRYQPTAELFHLERQSIQKHAGYMRGIACAYNRRLHSSRWSDLMERLCPPTGDASNDDHPLLAGAAE